MLGSNLSGVFSMHESFVKFASMKNSVLSQQKFPSKPLGGLEKRSVS